MEGVCQKLETASTFSVTHSLNSYLWSFRPVTQISYFNLFSRQLEVKKIHWKLKEMSGRGPLQYSLRAQPLSFSFPMYFVFWYFVFLFCVSHYVFLHLFSHTPYSEYYSTNCNSSNTLDTFPSKYMYLRLH